MKQWTIGWGMAGLLVACMLTGGVEKSMAETTFHDALTSRLADDLDSRTPGIRPAESIPRHRLWAPIKVAVPEGGELTIELPEYINAFGDHLPDVMDKAFLSGRTALAHAHQPAATPEWVRYGDTWRLEVACPPDVRLTYEVTASPGRVDVVSRISNHTGGTLENAFQVLCTSFSKDSPYFSIDPRTTHFLHDGSYVSWPAVTDLDEIWRPDSEDSGEVYWLECPVAGSGRVLNPYHRRAVMTGEADAGVIVQDHQADSAAKLLMIAEPGGSVFKNCRGGCLHANPMHADISDGETGEVVMTLLFARDGDMGRVVEEAWTAVGGQ